MDELAITRAKLTLSRAEFFVEETKFNAQIQLIPLKRLEENMTPMVTSCTQSTIEREQPLQEKGMSIQELVAKYMNENENMTEMSFKRQQESFPSTLEVNKEEENFTYNEEIILRGNEELKKFQRVENDAQTSKDLFSKEKEDSTSPESHEKIKDEVIKTILEMTLWGEMHKELKNEKMTPISEVDEYIIQLNNKLKGNIVKQTEKKFIKMLFNDYVPKMQLEHNYRFLGTDEEGHHHSYRSSMSQAGL